MKIEQIYTGCLAEAAYYIECDGEAAIIDPLRETKPYLDRVKQDGAKLKYIFETHFHADFVSGHIDLSNKSGATIVFGPTAAPEYKAYIAKDGEEFKLGSCTLRLLHTPGHTLESSCILLLDESNKRKAVFTGDTLFVGDVGRPDLVQKVKAEVTPQYLAGLLFDSLRTKLMTLPDDVVLYPGHGAGSACGKKMSKETVSTMGQQKQFNYALRSDMSKDEFVKAVTDGLVEPPQYFPSNVLMNVLGNVESLDEIMKKGNHPWSVSEFEEILERESTLIIDTRSKEDFAKGFIPRSIFIGIDDSFAPWVGALITNLQQPILFIADEGKEEEVITRLARVGYDNTWGYLKGGINAWIQANKKVEVLEEVSATEFEKLWANETAGNLLDVRRASEYSAEHLVGSQNFPLDTINQHWNKLDKTKKYFVHCAGGYRSVIASSILKAKGYNKLINIKGGYKALSETKLMRTDHKEVLSEL